MRCDQSGGLKRDVLFSGIQKDAIAFALNDLAKLGRQAGYFDRARTERRQALRNAAYPQQDDTIPARSEAEIVEGDIGRERSGAGRGSDGDFLSLKLFGATDGGPRD